MIFGVLNINDFLFNGIFIIFKVVFGKCDVVIIFFFFIFCLINLLINVDFLIFVVFIMYMLFLFFIWFIDCNNLLIF